MENEFSKYLTGFRKNHKTQNSLLRIIEFWKAKSNNGLKDGVIIMDLSKAFDSLNHDFSLAKLEAYGLDNNAVCFTRSYLTNRFQRCKINKRMNENICWDPTGTSILGPLLFSIFINDIFLFLQKCDRANYADDSLYHKQIRMMYNSKTIFSKQRFFLNICH